MNSNRGGRSLVLALALAALTLVFTACGDDDDDGGGGGGETNKVTFALGFSPNYGQAPFFAALDAGYYEDAGLDVDYVVPDSTQTAAKLVGVGRADAAEFFGLDPVTSAGEGIPTQVVATWAWGDLGLMVDPGNDEVNEVADLEGKTVGIFSGLPYSEACRPRLLEANGLSPDDIETVDIGFNSVTPLLTGKVDASEGGEPAETVTMELEAGAPPKFLRYSEACPPFLFGVFVNRDWAAENPETARKFVEATMKGAKLASEDPEETHRLFTERFADLEQPLVQFERFGAAICGPDSATEGLGYIDQAAYEDLIKLGEDEGLVQEELVYDDVVTDEYLPEEPVKSSACK
jgi:putative hydroxymethylpyrimidine transport system substrate-binding protein